GSGGSARHCRANAEHLARLRLRAYPEQRIVDEGRAVFVGSLQCVAERERTPERGAVGGRVRHEKEIRAGPASEDRARGRYGVEAERLALAIERAREPRPGR